jgi:Na+-translocating ferredoxin:NAD+ oxidoreductase subunit E
MEVRVLPEDVGVLLVLLPPGGFFALGLLIALKRLIDQRVAQGTPLQSTPTLVSVS